MIRFFSRLTARLCLPTAIDAADLELHVSTNPLTELRGWELMPVPYDRPLPTYADGSPAHGGAGWPSGARSQSAASSWRLRRRA